MHLHLVIGMSDFYTDLERGEVGENKFIELCNRLNFKCVDVSDEKEYQDLDVDFIVDNTLVEVKTDYKIAETSNLYIEVWSSNKIGYKGWYQKTKCEYMYVYDVNNKLMYGFCFNDLKEYVDLFKFTERVKRCGNNLTANINMFFCWLKDNKKFNKIYDEME